MAIHSNTSKCKVFVVFFEKPLHLISPKIGLFLSISTFLCFSANPKLVAEKTNNQVHIETYHSAQLGQERELLESMQFGNLDLAAITSSPITNFTPEFGVLDMPYLFKDWDHLEAFVSSDVAKEIFSLTESAGLKTFAMVPRGFRHVVSAKEPIYSLEDIKGMKIRVIESPIYVDTFKALGADPQAMNWGDAVTALQQGAIDGIEQSLEIVDDTGVHELAKNISKTGHMAAFVTIMASKTKFDSLPDNVKTAIEEAAVEAAQAFISVNRERESELETGLKEFGVTFNEVEFEPFRQAVQPIYDQSSYGEYIQAIEDLK
jgi:tripartite ATP-independent transporter DctP family solute receptor